MNDHGTQPRTRDQNRRYKEDPARTTTDNTVDITDTHVIVQSTVLSEGLLVDDNPESERNSRFWDEMCGTNSARELGIADSEPESLSDSMTGSFRFIPISGTIWNQPSGDQAGSWRWDSDMELSAPT